VILCLLRLQAHDPDVLQNEETFRFLR
jgi:hypothetical protein